jgi:hypothetical protein
MSFTVNGAVFGYGVFAQSLIQTIFTVIALFYLVVRASSSSVRAPGPRSCPPPPFPPSHLPASHLLLD